MENYHSSKSLHLPCKTLSLVVLLFVYLLLIGSCDAIRMGQTMKLNERREILKGKHNNQHGFPYKSMVFNFFPKGSVPPSGPSKRHNAVVDSTPNNWSTWEVHFVQFFPFFSSFFLCRIFWFCNIDGRVARILIRSNFKPQEIRSLKGSEIFWPLF